MKFFVSLLIFLLAGISLGGYFFYTSRRHVAQQHQVAKAPDKKITLIEGWTIEEAADYLQETGLATKPEFLKAEKEFPTGDFPLLSSKPQNADLEGFLFPDTYRITGKVQDGIRTSQEIITRALDNFSVKFTPEMQQAAIAREMSVYEIVTLASIIERETGRNAVTAAEKQALQQERNTVAGIFYNRLKAGMPLQSDATVNYITKKNTPSASAQDITLQSPYNTYLFKGLPPGPICNPSLSSLMAAVFPAQTDFLYFLHKQPSGEPVFSRTYEEHVRNKLKYLK